MEKFIVWFQNDLRLSDNPAFTEAVKSGKVLPAYILDEASELGAASKWWLHHSLSSLNQSLENKLSFFQGDPVSIILSLVERGDITGVFWNRNYEPLRIKQAEKLKASLKEKGVLAKSFNGTLLWEPWEVTKADGSHYKVFTPFYQRGCLAASPPRKSLNKPANIDAQKVKASLSLCDLGLLPDNKWYEKFDAYWEPGEAGAKKRLKSFVDSGIDDYKKQRDFPAQSGTSKLSPHLHFGEVSPNYVWYFVKNYDDSKKVEPFLRQLVWREFSYHLLFHYPTLPNKNWREQFDRFPWKKDKSLLDAWQKGMTGYPIVDAGMRELWETGYMHNRVRMIVASFLVKNGLIDWRVGAEWFWDCLVDADLANNGASWQWVAGSGADAAPYFRIFNPILQAKKFDPDGEYIRRFVPEIAELPNKYLFAPWEAPVDALTKAGIVLGKIYPERVLGLKETRDRALAAFKKIK